MRTSGVSFLSSVLFFFIISTNLWSFDYFFTRSAFFKDEGFLSLSIDYQQFIDRAPEGHIEGWIFHYPLRVDYAITRAVAVSLWIPFYSGVFNEERASIGDTTQIRSSSTPFAVGNLGFELRLGFEDLEYGFKSSYYFSYTLNTGPRGFEPFIPITQQATIGAIASKKVLKSTIFNLNVQYVYELRKGDENREAQSFTNFFSFNDFDQGRNEKTANGKDLRSRNLSLFGLEKIFQNFFWNTSLVDPWSEKRNDHLELSFSINRALTMHYDIRNRKMILGLNPFLEMAWVIPFSDESIVAHHFILAPGLYLKFTRKIRFLLSLAFALGEKDKLDYTQAGLMSLRFVF